MEISPAVRLPNSILINRPKIKEMWGFSWNLFNKKKKPMKLTGIDTSHHQGLIDWKEVATNVPKIDFVFIKATEGTTYTDPAMKFNATEAKKIGIPIGYYHFATLNTVNFFQDAKAEAIFFLSTVSKCPVPDLPLVLDIETNKSNLTKTEVLQWINTFFGQLKSLGVSNIMLYSYTPFLNDNLPPGHNLGSVPLWIAAYRPAPTIPTGWSEYTIWQYSAKGRVKGIRSDVDMNVSEKPLSNLH